MLRYSLKRLVLFVVCLAVTWLAFGRPTSVDGFIWPFAVAAVASAVLAYPMLRAERERFGAQIDRRVDAHLVHKHEQDSAKSGSKRSGAARDAAAEDTALDAASPSSGPQGA